MHGFLIYIVYMSYSINPNGSYFKERVHKHTVQASYFIKRLILNDKTINIMFKHLILVHS